MSETSASLLDRLRLHPANPDDVHTAIIDLTWVNSGPRFRYDAATFTLTIDLTVDGFGGSAATLLPDARYQLLDTAVIAALDDPANRLTDDDPSPDGFRRFDFHRLLTDWDGDAVVDLDDRDLFFAHYGSRTGDAAYDYAFDLNGDGLIDGRDYAFWKQRLGRRV